MIKIWVFVITLFAIIMLSYKRVTGEKYTSIKRLFININKQYMDIFIGEHPDLKTWQWILFVISQMFIVFAIVRGVFEEIYKYVSENYIVAVKVSTYIIIFVAVYFIVGYMLYSTRRIYKFLYKIEDKNTKTDLIISFFIISIYMTILILFPEQFSEIYKIGIVGTSISYFLNLKVLLRVIKSPEIINIKRGQNSNLEFSNMGVAAFILLTMVLLSLFLGVCFISSSGIGVYTNNPTYYDLCYYTIITFATIGYGDICPVSPAAKFMSVLISLTSILCLTIFVSSVLSYKDE